MPKLRSPLLIHQSVELWATVNPLGLAVVDGDTRLSYAGLSDKMRRLATAIQGLGIRRGSPVVFVMENSAAAYVAMCGILRADCCYVPLPPSWPSIRSAMVVEQIKPKLVITIPEHADYIKSVLSESNSESSTDIIVLDDDLEPKIVRSDSLIQCKEEILDSDCGEQNNIPEDIAYILFTSGTTGRPKGVMVNHSSVLNFLRWASDYFYLSQDDRISNHSSLSFDLSVFDVWGAFLSGACVFPLRAARDRMIPADFIRRNQLTVWFSVPGVISMMRQTRQLEAGFPSLRQAIFCGEAMHCDDASAWLEACPQAHLTNLYGPTEATVACSVFRVTPEVLEEKGTVPIGAAIDGVELLVLDDKDAVVGTDEIGHLYVCGAQLANGYWRAADLTAKAFRPNPYKADAGTLMYATGDLAYRDHDGVLHFVGRADTQIKYMGYRIELGEIDAAVTSCPQVFEAATVYLDNESPEIVVIATADKDAVSDDDVYQHCAQRLPNYMMPHRILFVEEMPRNINGKVDRRMAAEIAKSSK